MALVASQCPSCNGNIEVDNNKTSTKCQYCGTRLEYEKPQATGEVPQIHIHIQNPAQNNRNYPAPRPHINFNASKKLRTGCMILIVIPTALTIISMIIGTILSVNNNRATTTWPDNYYSPPSQTYTYPSNEPSQPDSSIIRAQDFVTVAEKAGYEMIIENDYDGFGTYWAGAHIFDDNDKIREYETAIYAIEYTKDANIYNSKVEYNLYVNNVKQIGGKQNSGEGDDYQFYVSLSDQQIGIIYRVADVNMYAIAPAEYADKILAFFDAIGFGVEIN